jgi:16S rRNA (cytidine1402-2'-O)-methyltransferase
MSTPTSAGELRVVATPIGNLDDIAPRAVEALRSADAICCEDTRHSRPLLQQFGIDRPLLALHEHNEAERVGGLVARMLAGERIALISDAGTPLVSDPGYRLVRAAREAGIRVTPLPGPCAAIAALSVAGIASDRFVFEGFLPAKPAARQQALRGLLGETRTLVFYESAHRIVDSLADLAAVFGGERRAALARELSKRFETVLDGPLAALHARVSPTATSSVASSCWWSRARRTAARQKSPRAAACTPCWRRTCRPRRRRGSPPRSAARRARRFTAARPAHEQRRVARTEGGTMMAASPACPHCGKPVKLDEAQVRVPYRRRHWWQFGDERNEFRCRHCQGFGVLRLSRFGLGLYAAELVALGWGWMHGGLPRMGLVVGGLALAALLFRHAVALRPA